VDSKRALTYKSLGEATQAKKDLEKIIATDSDSSNWREEFNAVLKKLDAENKKFKMLISGSNVDSATSSERETPAEKIKALGELLNLGLISEKEFKEKKAQLLKQI